MCTLTFVPVKEQAIITVNRDEAPSRAAGRPEIRELNGRRFWLAPEPVSGGSNTVLDIVNRRLHVLLNGAFESHTHNPPYRISRGVMMLEAFHYDSLADMAREYRFTGIEPFTLLNFQDGKWEELRWDEHNVHLSMPSSEIPSIWSSTKLYPKEEIQHREHAFGQFIQEKRAVYPQQLFEVHQRDREDARGVGFRMNFEDRVKTVSITQLLFDKRQVLLRYLDLVQKPQELLERSF